MQALLVIFVMTCGVPLAAGTFMVLPQRHPVVRWIGFGVLMYVLWVAVILIVLTLENHYS